MGLGIMISYNNMTVIYVVAQSSPIFLMISSRPPCTQCRPLWLMQVVYLLLSIVQGITKKGESIKKHTFSSMSPEKGGGGQTNSCEHGQISEVFLWCHKTPRVDKQPRSTYFHWFPQKSISVGRVQGCADFIYFMKNLTERLERFD